jgi:predicted PurR-regulated permease PerM
VPGTRRVRQLISRRETRRFWPLIVLATVVLVAGTLYWARTVLVPVTLAGLLAFLLGPVVGALQRRGLPRGLAVLLVVIVAISVIGGAAWVVTTQLYELAGELPLYSGNIKQRVADVRGMGRGTVLGRLQRLIDDVGGEMRKDDAPADADDPVPVVIKTDPRQAVLARLPTVLEGLVTLALIVAMVVFMLVRRVDLRNRLIRLVGYGRLPVATKALDEAADRITHYLVALSIINGTFGVAVATGLFLIGLPYAVLWGVMAGLLRFVPYMGAWVAALLPLTLSLAVFKGWFEPLLVLALFAVVEPLIFMVVEPLVYGVRTGVSDVAVLVAVGFWTWLWGPIGLLLATPLTVCVVVIGKYVPALEFLVVLLGEESEMAPDVGYYQRLLAGDRVEAEQIVKGHLASHSPDSVYDAVILPALSAARRDRLRGRLTAEDEQFIVSATDEILDELEPRAREGAAADVPAPPAPVRVLACPSRDDLDELALRMLTVLLPLSCCEVELLAPDLLSAEAVALARETGAPLVCVGLVGPGGTSHARYLIKRLRAALPDTRIVVGRFGGGADGGGADGRGADTQLKAAGADAIGRTLEEVRDEVLRLVPVLAGAGEPTRPAARARAS